jgi:hypothetical protein
MRWIDIDLSDRRISQDAEDLFAEARRVAEGIPAIQARDGLDGPLIIPEMKRAGECLFRAVMMMDKEAFHPDLERPDLVSPGVASSEHDALIGYHLVTLERHLGLPWAWLHNGVAFLAAKHPICASIEPSAPVSDSGARAWMQRWIRAGYLVGKDGSTSLKAILPQMNGNRSLGPEVLFVPGHTEEAIRRLIYREAEAIEQALKAGPLGEPLARMTVPTEALTPSQLPELGLAYQAIHFAGPTSQRMQADDKEGALWMDRLLEEAVAPSDQDLESAIGLEGEVLGVDPITSLLDDVCHKFDHAGAVEESLPLARPGNPRQSGPAGGANSSSAPGSDHHWLLPDGPVDPERISLAGGIPPLVFSNSYRSLPELGPRFTRSGASAFVGPMVPLFSRPARIFAGHCYGALGEGWCVGAAVWKAGRACRRELGENHPAWLSYGLQGYGSLALQYL